MSAAISVRRTAVILYGSVASLVFLAFATQALSLITGRVNLLGLVPAFHLNKEGNIPSFYSALQLLLASGLVFLIARQRKEIQDKWFRHWKLLGWILLYLSVDEAAQLHENLVYPVRSVLGIQGGWLFYAWVVPAIGILIVLLALYSRFLFGLPKGTRNRFAVAGTLYVGGALGLEMVEGYYITSLGGHDLIYELMVVAEESLELVGVTVFVVALLDVVREEIGTVGVRVFA